ncbi:unnamed protein product [Bursaphelenchus xylophilus]|uniref:(pine wood nematode) hypothetical protein n=1 Tax=Bursaphelenchus xylophilus TaxID=6326 RepID=A0A1I7S6K5_BURXY|nr:unnamed protein product [Bursaphelenchus xylophilus]CAG9120518.1 unnamed protein product [Bursaphelenchus xylophilus]
MKSLNNAIEQPRCGRVGHSEVGVDSDMGGKPEQVGEYPRNAPAASGALNETLAKIGWSVREHRALTEAFKEFCANLPPGRVQGASSTGFIVVPGELRQIQVLQTWQMAQDCGQGYVPHAYNEVGRARCSKLQAGLAKQTSPEQPGCYTIGFAIDEFFHEQTLLAKWKDNVWFEQREAEAKSIRRYMSLINDEIIRRHAKQRPTGRHPYYTTMFCSIVRMPVQCFDPPPNLAQSGPIGIKFGM